MNKNVIFMIESGKALEMVKQHISERQRVWKEVRLLAKELGVERIQTDRTNGVLRAVNFTSDIHPDFTKPKGRDLSSYPKKGTAWAKRLAAQKGYRDPSEWISTEFTIPLNISYQFKGGHGSSCIGNFLNECGFLYLGEDGPYAMWVPDVPAYVAQYTSNGSTVDEPAASFKLKFDGCRRIEDEEWEILVLQNKLAEKTKQAA